MEEIEKKETGEKRDGKPESSGTTKSSGHSRRLWKLFAHLGRTGKAIVTGVIVLAAAGVVFWGWKSFFSAGGIFDNQEGKVVSVLESSLEKIEFESSLSSLEYTYNSAVPVYREGGQEKGEEPIYYVRYDGKVKMGIDFSLIQISADPDDPQHLIVLLPPVSIMGTSVDPGTFDFIYRDPSAHTETVMAESLQICQKDLEEAASKDGELKTIAMENVENEISLLMDPIVESLDQKLEVELKWQAD